MRWLRILAASAVLAAAASGVARAHAYVVGTQPPADSSAADPRGTIGVSFDEPVDVLDADAVEVFDSFGRRIDRRDASIDPQDATRAIVHVPVPLARGTYSVRWRVVSADTHVVHGAYLIGIGVVPGGGAANDTASPFDPAAPLATLLRTFNLLAALAIGGAVLLRIAMFDRLSPLYDSGVATARAVVVAASAAILAAAIPSLLVQSAAAAGAFGGDVLPTLRSTWGIAFAVRVAADLGLLAIAGAAWRRSGMLTGVLACALLATFCVSGHALGMPGGAARLTAVLFDFGHIAAAAAWIGGIFVLVTALGVTAARGGIAKAREIAWLLFANFTPIAFVAVGVVLITGSYASVVHVGTIANLFGTLYGRLVLVKVCAFLVLLAFGYLHMRLGTLRASASGRTTLLFEGALGTIVVAVTALLVGQSPPH